MKLEWRKVADCQWDLKVDDPDSAVDTMAWLVKDEDRPRVYHITYWTTLSDTEQGKDVEFEGTLREAKAYTVALVRVG